MGATIRLVLVIVALNVPTSCRSVGNERVSMNESQIEILKTSQDVEELYEAATTLADSDNVGDQEALCASLRSAEFLKRLDPPDEEAAPTRPRVAAVVGLLGENRADAAKETLVKLTTTTVYLSDGKRVEALISACASLRQPSEQVIKFWDMYCQDGDGFSHGTIRALLDNGSPPALELFKKKMLDPEHIASSKTYWMHNIVLPHRDDPRLLEVCGDLLKGGLPPDLKPVMIESLFDYDISWYPPSQPPKAPPLATYSRQARTKLIDIGTYALRELKLKPKVRAVVEDTVKRLRDRGSGE